MTEPTIQKVCYSVQTEAPFDSVNELSKYNASDKNGIFEDRPCDICQIFQEKIIRLEAEI